MKVGLAQKLAMPRYFFHVHDGQDMPDLQGVELPNLVAARNQAVVFLGEMLKELADGRFWRGSAEWRMRVADETGATVCSLRLSGD